MALQPLDGSREVRSTVVSCRTYGVDPVHVGADLGEDGGLLGVVTAESQTEAHDTVDLPGTFSVLAVQGSARVSLNHNNVPNITICILDILVLLAYSYLGLVILDGENFESKETKCCSYTLFFLQEIVKTSLHWCWLPNRLYSCQYFHIYRFAEATNVHMYIYRCIRSRD